MAKKNEQKCACCEEEARFFHSRCCGAHFEGVILPDGKWAIVCEKCNKFVAYLVMPK